MGSSYPIFGFIYDVLMSAERLQFSVAEYHWESLISLFESLEPVFFHVDHLHNYSLMVYIMFFSVNTEFQYSVGRCFF